MSEKQCCKCKQTKPLDSFHLHRSTRDGHQNFCKDCKSELWIINRENEEFRAKEVKRHAKYKVANKEKVKDYNEKWNALNQKYYKDWHLRKKYGISLDEFEELLAAQGGVCAIRGCGSRELLSLDHCHITGTVRGVLCRNHNTAIGMLNDDPALLRAGADYLEQYR